MVSRSTFNQMQNRADVATADAESARLREQSARHKESLANKSAQVQSEASMDVMGAAVGLVVQNRRLKEKNKIITERSREFLFQIAMKDTKFRATIEQMKKAFPEHNGAIDSCVENVDHLYDGERAAQFRKGKRAATEELHDYLDKGGTIEQALEALKRPPPKNSPPKASQ